MKQRIGHITLVVENYAAAIAFYTQQLGFDLIADTAVTATERWVVVAPHGAPGSQIVFALATNERERAAVGNQTGGRVALFLQTDDFARDFSAYTQRGVTFLERPRKEPYGTVAVFCDLYGNRWDLIEPAGPQ